jgi:hypothetical protein
MKPEPRVFCVTGMHRSGTSLVAGMLNMLDVDLGPVDQLLPPQPDNPRGFWEHSGFTSLNDEILAAMGGRWDEPPALPPHWHGEHHLEPLRVRARQLIRTRSGRGRIWAWKDPRNSLTLPFWRSLLPQMRFVVCLRNPVDVSRSLGERNGFAPAKSEGLWLRYTQEALTNTTGGERLLLFYEDLVSDAVTQLRRLAAFVRPRRPGPTPAGLRSLRRSIEPELHHHRSSILEVFDSERLAFPSQALYAVLRAREGGDRPSSLPDSACDRFAEICLDAWGRAEASKDLAKRLQAAQAHCRELQIAQARQEDKLRLQTVLLEGRERALEAARREAAGLAELLDSERRRAVDLAQALQQETAATADLRASLHGREEDVRHLTANLRGREEEVGHLTATLRAITESRAYPVLTAIWAVANFLAPVGSRRGRVLRALLTGGQRPD